MTCYNRKVFDSMIHSYTHVFVTFHSCSHRLISTLALKEKQQNKNERIIYTDRDWQYAKS